MNGKNTDISNDAGELHIRPYARLITMIGEQLIRNETIALLELIKNSYDADARQVEVRFINFEQKNGEYQEKSDSAIEIIDNGDGMTLEIIMDAWMNPASPNKYLKKKAGLDRTKSGRIIQGEKGIGRFAVFKIGKTVELYTRSITKPSQEIYVKCDLSLFDNELLSKSNEKKPTTEDKLFLEDIKYQYEIHRISEIQEKRWQINNKPISNGTILRISNLKSTWSKNKISSISEGCSKLLSPFNKTDFTYNILINGDIFEPLLEEKNRLDELMDDAELHMTGEVAKEGTCRYTLGGVKGEIELKDLASDFEVKKRFTDKEGRIRKPECGPFSFEFYVFDFERMKDSIGNRLNKSDKDLIKKNRIYLYRDGLRVIPYGDPDDDWIGLDILRGTIRAGAYLSNDQVMGRVGITSNENPDLRDKTNREGLIDAGNAYGDLKTLVLGILGILNTEFKKNKIRMQSKTATHLISGSETEKDLKSLRALLQKKGDKESTEALDTATLKYNKEKEILISRAEIIEDLAGVGLTVDAASHDLMIMLKRTKETLNSLLEMIAQDNIERARATLEKLKEQFVFIEDQMHGIQPLFRSTRRKSKSFSIKDVIKTVQRYYTDPIEKSNIQFEIKEINPPLIVKCTEAVLLQVFINLLDNAVYWLTIQDSQSKKIVIIIDGSKKEVVFADNGPGVRKDDTPYIFEPFFSTKGISGRGLGLYIARQLLERNDFEISYIEQKNKQVLGGANFVVTFSDKGEGE